MPRPNVGAVGAGHARPSREGETMTTMPSSLEIAQAATLRPILDVAADAGLLAEEVEPYGRYKAKVDLSVIERLADRPDAKLINVTAITPTPAGEGKTTTSVVADAGARCARPEARPLPARGIAWPSVRGKGRRRRRWLRAGRAHGGPEPPLHRRPARDHGRQQPALGADRRAPACTETKQASTRSRSRGGAAST